MQSSLEKLRKLFRLEHGNGYSNTAVIGGLVNILNFWESEARNEHIPEPLIQAVGATLRAYADQPPAQRTELLKSLWKQIQASYPQDTPTHSPANAPSMRPPIPPARSLPPEPPAESAPAPLPELPAEALPECSLETIVEISPEAAANISIQPLPTPQPAPPAFPRPQRPTPGRADSRPGGVTSKRPIALNASLTVLAGVGPRHASMLTRLGLNTLGDMLYYFPRRYDDYSQLKPIREVFYGQQVTVIGEVNLLTSRPLRGGKSSLTEAIINDGTAALRLTWFNQPWLANQIKVGHAISVSGKVEQYLGRLVMSSPDWEPVEVENLHTNRIVPVYPLTANVTQKWLRKLMYQVITYWAPKLTDHLPESIRQAAALPDLGTALLQRIFPTPPRNCRLPASAWPSTSTSSCRPVSCASAGTGSQPPACSSPWKSPGWKRAWPAYLSPLPMPRKKPSPTYVLT